MTAPAPIAGPTLTVAEFDAAPADEVRELLGACLDIPRWVDEVADGRPYRRREALLEQAARSAERVQWDEVAGALARHPRIGQTPSGPGENPGMGVTDARLSATEQSGVRPAERQALAEGNAAYEKRFGHIYLICASGLSGAQMLAALKQRLNNDERTERRVVVEELGKIAALRLQKAVTA
ncbi:2-oxo-4-hydroxy-4-carboxy-5-ureidoimidazoline decarboxylase [Nakamurella sp. GG22]